MSAGAKGTVPTKNKGTVHTAKSNDTVPLDMGSKKTVLVEIPTDRFNLEKWKCYLESCATYHTLFVREFLDRVYWGKTAMNGSCNYGTVTNNTRGWYGKFKVWLNEKGIANLLSISMLEYSGYIVYTHTKGDWVITTTKGKKIVFKNDTGVCKGMPYIDLCEHKEGISMIETVCKKFAGATMSKYWPCNSTC